MCSLKGLWQIDIGHPPVRLEVVPGCRLVCADCARERAGPEGEFRSNLHRGGRATLVELTDEERALAIRSARIIGLNTCGVDILRARRGPLVMEVNASPGLEGIEQATGLDIAGMMVGFVERHARPHRTGTQGQ